MIGKKAQVTLFIIVGIIVLIGAGLYFGIREDIITGELDVSRELVLEEVPTEFVPVRSFMDSCLREVGKEGLEFLGNRGGFVDLVGNEIITRADATTSAAVGAAFVTGSDTLRNKQHAVMNAKLCLKYLLHNLLVIFITPSPEILQN